MLRQNYGGFPIIDNDHFDTEMVSKIIFDMKRGKAADIYRKTSDRSPRLLLVQFTLTPGLYPGPGV